MSAALLCCSQYALPYRGYRASADFTPAASSHVAGDVVGGAQEFALKAPPGELLTITSASLMIAGASPEATAWRLYLFNITPPLLPPMMVRLLWLRVTGLRSLVISTWELLRTLARRNTSTSTVSTNISSSPRTELRCGAIW